MRYLVMETHAAHAVVLDEQGVFLQVVNKGYEVGQYLEKVIAFQPLKDEEKEKKIIPMSVIRGLAAVACASLVIWGGLQNYVVTYGKVHMQITPDLVLSVNKQQQVTSIEALNQEGEELLEGYDYQMKKVDEVVEEILSMAEAQEYVTETEDVQVEVTCKQRYREWGESTRQVIEDALKDNTSQESSVVIEETTDKWEPIENWQNHDSNTKHQNQIQQLQPENNSNEEDSIGEGESLQPQNPNNGNVDGEKQGESVPSWNQEPQGDKDSPWGNSNNNWGNSNNKGNGTNNNKNNQNNNHSNPTNNNGRQMNGGKTNRR